MDTQARNGVAEAGALRSTPADAAAGLAVLLDEWAHGVVLAGDEGVVLHANQAARHELVRIPPIAGTHSRRWRARFHADRGQRSAVMAGSCAKRRVTRGW